MYRSAARRLLPHRPSLCGKWRPQSSPFRTLAIDSTRSLSSATPEPSSTQGRSDFNGASSSPFSSASSSSSSSSSSSTQEDKARRGESHSSRRPPPETHYQEEQARVLASALCHVIRLGWTEAALVAGAREAGLSPSIVGSFPRKEVILVEYFMDECLERLIDMTESVEDLKNLVPSERITKLVRVRLEMQAPYISKWHQALSIQAQPSNVPTSFKQRATLVDEIWHAAGDESSDMDWYVKRTLLGGIYSTTEVYMLTDNSPDFQDTWVFLNNRVRDAFDLKKTVQEVKYLAEAVGAGVGSSFQEFVKRAF